MTTRSVVAAFFILLLFSKSQAQDTLSSAPVNKSRLRIVAVSTAALYTGSMIALSNEWYSQTPQQSFHFFNDFHEWKQVDKVGHIYSAFQLSSIGSQTLRWCNVPQRKADDIGTLTSIVIMSSIEVLDGFSQGYGASATDLAADVVGAGFYWGQNRLWKEVRIYPKFSFHQTAYAAQNPDLLGSGLSQEFLKDYNGQTYWLSADMDKFIRFPKWLNLSVGYGAEDMIYAMDADNKAAGYHPYRQFYLGLDLDLTAFRGRSKFLNSLIYFANMIRIPAPALEFSQGKVKGHWLYF
jgi:uncharacterized protein YfiM (DUF2279 family)